MSEFLRMDNITKRFGDVFANKNINLSVKKGEVHTLLGENGAGKSTLMNILCGLYQPTSGEIYLEGKKVKIDSPRTAVKIGIGMVHQHFMVVEAMTVFENIILGTSKDKSIFALYLPYCSIYLSSTFAFWAISVMGCILHCCAISISDK